MLQKKAVALIAALWIGLAAPPWQSKSWGQSQSQSPSSSQGPAQGVPGMAQSTADSAQDALRSAPATAIPLTADQPASLVDSTQPSPDIALPAASTQPSGSSGSADERPVSVFVCLVLAAAATLAGYVVFRKR